MGCDDPHALTQCSIRSSHAQREPNHGVGEELDRYLDHEERRPSPAIFVRKSIHKCYDKGCSLLVYQKVG
jgi:hypothetical protein